MRFFNSPTLCTGARLSDSLWPKYMNMFQGSSSTFHRMSQNGADPTSDKSHPGPARGWELKSSNKQITDKKNQ